MYNGTVIWHPGDVFKTTCSFDIYRYPFDKQICYVIFTPWSYLANEVRLRAADDNIDTSFYQENGQWELLSLSSEEYIQNDVSFVQLNIRFHRRSRYFVVNIILPIFMLAFLNCLAFVIPVESGERISYTVTLLLSFAVFMTLVSDNVPKTSSPMSLLCYFLAALYTGSVSIMIVIMLNMRLFYRNSSIKMSPVYVCIYRLCCRRKKRRQTRVNKIKPDGSVCTSVKTNSEDSEAINDISWQELAEALDIVGFILSLLYYISISIAVNLM
ncbi:acetylcholine receptor subunit beta-type unc-29-like [Ruditapes philippinarum]|uniref:acetylcholine receptor subunit beta-type unc-29-like n=1 Tax=Ruditapes philippinarum TaxID=129788 RepID=UPI00295B27F9|nr:acetylcholine receptor subunit beta-type unc-29-like [Ruditapes philippinarum]